MKRNLIAHYQQGGSDKVYLSCIRDNGDGTLSVLGKWGRRGNIKQQQVKATVNSIVAAEVEQKRLFLEKLAKGYVDIDSSGYNGGVTRQSSFLASHLEPDTAIRQKPLVRNQNSQLPISDTEEETPQVPDVGEETKEETAESLEDGVVICANNIGMEEKFDVGVEYVAEPHDDKTLIWVYDKFGQKGEYFRDRFHLPSQQKPNFKQFNAGESLTIRFLKSNLSKNPDALRSWVSNNGELDWSEMAKAITDNESIFGGTTK